MANYYIKYNDLQTQATSLQNISKTLEAYESRLNSIANAMDGRDTSMVALKAQVLNCGKTIPVLSKRITAGSTLATEALTVYSKTEKMIYDAVSGIKETGGLWKSGVGAMLGAVGAISVGSSSLTHKLNLFKSLVGELNLGKKWISGAISGGAAGIYNLARLNGIDVSSLEDLKGLTENVKLVGDLITITSAGISIFSTMYSSIENGESTSRVVGNVAGETLYQAGKVIVKKAVCGKGAAIGAAIGSVIPGAGTVAGAVIGGAVGYIVSSIVIDKGFEWIDKTFKVRETISDAVTTLADNAAVLTETAVKTARAVGGAVKETGKAIGSFLKMISQPIPLLSI